MDVNGVIALGGVTGRNINTSRGPGVVYDIAAQVDGQGGVKFGTFDGELAGSAKALENTRVTFRYQIRSSTKNGTTYQNFDLQAIAPEGSLPAEAAEAAAAGGIPIVGAGGAPGGARRGGGGGTYKPLDPEVQRMIVKQSLFSTAHDFTSSIYHGLGPDFFDEASAKAEALAAKLYGIVTKNYNAANPPAGAPADPVAAATVPAVVVPAVATPVETAPIVPTATTPAEVAAAVPGVTVGAAAVASPAPSDPTLIAWD